jgi:hypothetical protein
MLSQVTGIDGVVRFGAVPAATLKSWRLQRRDDATAWDLSATASQVNQFYVAQAPLSLSLRVGDRDWRWEAVALEIVGTTARGVVVGRPEVR